MGRAPAARLKVFQAQIGFYDTVVAVPSQAAALRAWGVHQDLFASGDARLATDEAAIGAALEHPTIPLRRALGSADMFSLEPTSLPRVPDLPKTRSKPSGKRAPPPPAPADRSALDAAETALREIDAARMKEEARFLDEAKTLESKRAAAQENYVRARKQANDRVLAARREYRSAGGAD